MLVGGVLLFGEEAQPFGDEVIDRTAGKAGFLFQVFVVVCRGGCGQGSVEQGAACRLGGSECSPVFAVRILVFFEGDFALHGFGVTQVVHVARGVECGQRGLQTHVVVEHHGLQGVEFILLFLQFGNGFVFVVLHEAVQLAIARLERLRDFVQGTQLLTHDVAGVEAVFVHLGTLLFFFFVAVGNGGVANVLFGIGTVFKYELLFDVAFALVRVKQGVGRQGEYQLVEGAGVVVYFALGAVGAHIFAADGDLVDHSFFDEVVEVVVLHQPLRLRRHGRCQQGGAQGQGNAAFAERGSRDVFGHGNGLSKSKMQCHASISA